MLKIAGIVLVLLWALGVFTHHMMGGFIHVLLVLAVILVLIGAVKGEKF
jgi:uncharacterized membrane protein